MFKPDKAFLLAAGKGTRLRPYTNSMPKPMVPINGRSIIERALDKLQDDGVRIVVINLHHLGDTLENHLKDRTAPKIVLSREDTLLETGGGAKKALPHFENAPFYMINGDALWEDDKEDTALARLAQNWNDDAMDMILLLQPVTGMTLTHGVGDYTIKPDGRARRTPNKDGTHMFAGIRIVHPRLFDGTPDGAFSFLSLMDKAEQEGRLYAVEHRGAWHHISTPEELERVDAHYREMGA